MTTETVAGAPTRAPSERFSGWWMVVIAFLAQNCAMGMNIGIYGTLVQAIQSEFATTRTLAATGVSLMTLALGLLAPVVGWLTGRVTLRALMIAGATLCAVGYVLLYFVTNIYALLAIYAVVIGPGVAALGVVPASTLVGNWFVEGRGRALGIVNTPFFILVFPFVAAFMLSHYGLRSVFVTGAVCMAVLIPILFAVVQKPEQIGQRPLGGAAAVNAQEAMAGTALTIKQLLTRPAFWIVTIGISILTWAGLMMVSHIVALALGRGVPLASASLLLGTSGAMGVVGSLVFGWLSDRIGLRWSFIVDFIGSIAAWLVLMYAGANLPALVVASLLLGISAGSTIVLFSAGMSAWLGQENMSRSMGLSYLMQSPFMFASGPLAGYLFDVTGSYNAAILLSVALFALLIVLFLLYRPKATA